MGIENSDNAKIDLPKTGWTWADNKVVVRMGEIGVVAFRVYMALALHANDCRRCHPSVETIAEIAGVQRRAVQRALQRLVEMELLEIKPRRDLRKRSLSNVYFLRPLPPCNQGVSGDALGCSQGHSRGVPGDTGRASPGTPKQEPREQEPEEQEDHFSFVWWNTAMVFFNDNFRGKRSPFPSTLAEGDLAKLKLVACLVGAERLRREWVADAIEGLRRTKSTVHDPVAYFLATLRNTSEKHDIDLDQQIERMDRETEGLVSSQESLSSRRKNQGDE